MPKLVATEGKIFRQPSARFGKPAAAQGVVAVAIAAVAAVAVAMTAAAEAAVADKSLALSAQPAGDAKDRTLV